MRELELGLQLPSPLQELHDDRLAGVRLLLKRDDLIHPEVTGNKWRKLKYLLADARAARASTLLTFGGAYSNHLRAMAAAGRIYRFATIGVVRGEEEPHNAVLDAAAADGMQLHYMDRATYRRKKRSGRHRCPPPQVR
jgi:1-aminocyclopropane-1-carboxylate deaminase